MEKGGFNWREVILSFLVFLKYVLDTSCVLGLNCDSYCSSIVLLCSRCSYTVLIISWSPGIKVQAVIIQRNNIRWRGRWETESWSPKMTQKNSIISSMASWAWEMKLKGQKLRTGRDGGEGEERSRREAGGLGTYSILSWGDHGSHDFFVVWSKLKPQDQANKCYIKILLCNTYEWFTLLNWGALH